MLFRMKILYEMPAAIHLVHLLLAGIVHLVCWVAAILKILAKNFKHFTLVMENE